MGDDAFNRDVIWQAITLQIMDKAYMLQALSGVDIALWDIGEKRLICLFTH